MSLRRRTVVIAALAAGGLVLLAAGQTWVLATGLGPGAVAEVTADGSDASGVTNAMAFVVLAAALALTIARRVGRWIVGVLLVLAGTTLAVVAVSAAADPATAAASAVAEATGTTAAAASYAGTAWPWVAAGGGALAVLAGLTALVVGRRWSHSRRFEAPSAPTGDGGPSAADRGTADTRPDSMDAWDELTAGNDPTR
ncbi:Trp biosynthesis-associated membrane protein [Micrococcus luteus]